MALVNSGLKRADPCNAPSALTDWGIQSLPQRARPCSFNSCHLCRGPTTKGVSQICSNKETSSSVLALRPFDGLLLLGLGHLTCPWAALSMKRLELTCASRPGRHASLQPGCLVAHAVALGGPQTRLHDPTSTVLGDATNITKSAAETRLYGASGRLCFHQVPPS